MSAVAEFAPHHEPSVELIGRARIGDLAMAAHSYAEAYNTLTRRGPAAPFRFSSAQAWALLDGVRALTRLVGLTPPQTLDAVRRFSQQNGVGPRIYDFLIGEAARTLSRPAIITWNVRHMRGLFPDLEVATPSDYVARA